MDVVNSEKALRGHCYSWRALGGHCYFVMGSGWTLLILGGIYMDILTPLCPPLPKGRWSPPAPWGTIP